MLGRNNAIQSVEPLPDVRLLDTARGAVGLMPFANLGRETGLPARQIDDFFKG